LSCGRVSHSIFCVRVWNPGTNKLLPYLFCWKKKRSDFYLFIELSVPAWAPQWNDYLLKGKLNEFFVRATEELNRILASDK
jgi:hypothetical protein